MSAAQIIKPMKAASKLDKSTYNRWSSHYIETLILFGINDYVLEVKDTLNTRDSNSASKIDIIVHKQERNIYVANT